MVNERVQKILARAGIGSRRVCEKLIQEGRVKVNRKEIKLGDKADSQLDEIRVDGHLIAVPKDFLYIALYKPRGVLSSTQSQFNKKTVIDLIPVNERVYPVGRLDLESEGLVLLTNDGNLTNQLTHPRYGHEKEYRVLVAQHPDKEQLNTWRRGVVLQDGYKTAPAHVRFEKLQGKGAWLRVVMEEGRKRQIRETAMQMGLFVVKLIRIRISSLTLGSLQPGQWRYLKENEVRLLKGHHQKVKTPKDTR